MNYSSETYKVRRQRRKGTIVPLPFKTAQFGRIRKNSSESGVLTAWRLALDAYLRSIRFVTFVRQSFLSSGAKCLLIRILRQIAVTANHLFARLDANQPFGFAGIPGNFHSIGMHGFAPFRFPQYTREFVTFGAYQTQSCAGTVLSSLNPRRRAPCSDQFRCGP